MHVHDHTDEYSPATTQPRKGKVTILDVFLFFSGTSTTDIYTLSLHDALPIFGVAPQDGLGGNSGGGARARPEPWRRSEEHTSELQSRGHLVCRLLLEKKKMINTCVPRQTPIRDK